MATTPLGDCKGGCWQTQRSSLWGMLSMEQHKGTEAGVGSPLEGQD